MIRIIYGKITFEVETEAELRTVMGVVSKGAVLQEQPRLIPGQDVFIELHKMIDPSSKAYNLLQALIAKLDGVTMEELAKIGLSASILGGTLAGITKKAQKLGINGEDVIRGEASGLTWKYVLTEKMRSAIKNKQ